MADFQISNKVSAESHCLRLLIEKREQDDYEMSEKLNSNKTTYKCMARHKQATQERKIQIAINMENVHSY